MLTTRGRLLILTYHRVCQQPDALIAGNAHAGGFRRQMQMLACAFNVLPLVDAVERMHAGTLPSRAVCITFDDGYADNAEVAAPILAHYGLPATFFIATGFLDGGRMWNDTIIETVRAARGHALELGALGLGRIALDGAAARSAAIGHLIESCKYVEPDEREARADAIAAAAGVDPPRELMMRSDQVRALHDAGMEIGAHTVRHPILSSISATAAEQEIVTSRDRLSAIISAPVRSFAYPNGKPGVDYRSEHVEAVRRAGFTVAVSTAWGAARAGDDLWQLPRVGFADTSRWRFPLRLLRAYGDAAVGGESPGYATH